MTTGVLAPYPADGWAVVPALAEAPLLLWARVVLRRERAPSS